MGNEENQATFITMLRPKESGEDLKLVTWYLE